jgi:hypothetical protein
MNATPKEQKYNIDYLEILDKQENINSEFDKLQFDIPLNKRQNNVDLLYFIVSLNYNTTKF